MTHKTKTEFIGFLDTMGLLVNSLIPTIGIANASKFLTQIYELRCCLERDVTLEDIETILAAKLSGPVSN